MSSTQPKLSMILFIVRSLYIDILCIVHTLYSDSLRIHTLYTNSPRTHQKIVFFCNSKNFAIMISDLPKLQCIHEILLISSLSEYIFNSFSRDTHHRCSHKKLSQEALHQYSKRYSHKKLSIDQQKG